MRQELVNFVIANIPMPLAVVDKKLNLIDCSTPLLNNFTLNKKNIIGKNLFEAISDVPIKFNKAIRFGLSGHEEINNGEKFTLPNGKILWLKWKISPVRNDEDQVTGLMILLEDLTEYKKELELLHKAEAVARIGGWEVDLLKTRFIGPKLQGRFMKSMTILFQIWKKASIFIRRATIGIK
ncbi:MAG: PAS domain-containing protein [Maribacter sp.]